jgi:nicotinamidase-related amidase
MMVHKLLSVETITISWRKGMRSLTPPSDRSQGEILLIVDMISDFEFEDGEKLFSNTLPILEPLHQLKSSMRARGAQTVYVNDELGQGCSSLSKDLLSLRRRSERAAQVLDHLAPDSYDHWVVKPQRSGFYATGLGNLLLSLNVSSVVVAGVTTDICVFFTAHDAYMRGYSVWVPRDCTAAVETTHQEEALRFLARVSEADTTSSGERRRLLREAHLLTNESPDVRTRSRLREYPSHARAEG